MINRSTHVKRHTKYIGKYIGMFIAAAALTAAGASASLAQTPSQQQTTGAVAQTPERAQALHDCSVEASKWSFSTWQTTQIITYDDCMANHGQPE